MKMLMSRPETERVFIIAPPFIRDGADEMERRLKNADKGVCNPFRLLDDAVRSGMFANSLEDIEPLLVKHLHTCDGVCFVQGWEQSDLCWRLREVAIEEGKLQVKLRGFYR